MKTTGNSKRGLFESIIITLFWVIIFAAPLLFENYEDGINWNRIYRSWVRNVPLLVAFFVNRYVLLPYLFFSHRRGIYLLSIIGLVVAIALGASNLDKEVRGTQSSAFKERVQMEGQRRTPDLSTRQQARKRQARRYRPMPRSAVISFLCLMVIGLDTGLKSAMRLTKTEQEKAELQNENISNQLAFLRNQVSPHFFMNTLNNIHALIDIDSSEAKESIIKLSKLMRHLLYESESQMISLKKELNFILSYVELMRLRYSDKVDITLDIPDPIIEKSIPPLIFTSILENAFNYGISYGKQSFIHISIVCEPDELNFTISNSNFSHLKEQSASGIGLENTRKRLDLLYGKKYTMEISRGDDVFTVILKLPL